MNMATHTGTGTDGKWWSQFLKQRKAQIGKEMLLVSSCRLFLHHFFFFELAQIPRSTHAFVGKECMFESSRAL